jgi:hypothetical protein
MANEVVPGTLSESRLYGLGEGQTLVSLASVQDNGLVGQSRLFGSWELKLPRIQPLPSPIWLILFNRRMPS